MQLLLQPIRLATSSPHRSSKHRGRRRQAAHGSKRTLPEADQQRLDAVAARIDDDDDVAMAG